MNGPSPTLEVNARGERWCFGVTTPWLWAHLRPAAQFVPLQHDFSLAACAFSACPLRLRAITWEARLVARHGKFMRQAVEAAACGAWVS